MKNKIKYLIITILIICITMFFAIFAKDLLNNKAKLNESNSSNILDNIFNTNDEINLQEAYVTKVVDGDTIWVNIEGKEEKIRLIGVNSPEYTKEVEPYGKEATEFTTHKLLNKTIYLQKDVSDTDSYDRLLRYVWTDKIDVINEENIKNYLFNYSLVYEGYAESNYYKPDITLQSYLEDAQTQAKENKKGMWE